MKEMISNYNKGDTLFFKNQYNEYEGFVVKNDPINSNVSGTVSPMGRPKPKRGYDYTVTIKYLILNDKKSKKAAYNPNPYGQIDDLFTIHCSSNKQAYFAIQFQQYYGELFIESPLGDDTLSVSMIRQSFTTTDLVNEIYITKKGIIGYRKLDNLHYFLE